MLKKTPSIRSEIGKVLIISYLITTVSFVVLFNKISHDHRKTYFNQVKLLLEQVVANTSEEIANELFSGQRLSLLATLENINKLDNFVAIQSYLPSGEPSASIGIAPVKSLSDKQINALISSPEFKVIDTGQQELAVFSKSIVYSGEVFGFIEIHYSLEETLHYISNLQTLFMVMVIVAFILIFIHLNCMIGRFFINPVISLRNEMIGFDKEKWGSQIPNIPNNEIGDLVIAFNNMSMKLRNTCDDLEKSNTDLVEAIYERKKVLESIKRMEAEVDNRQRNRLAAELHDGVGQSLQTTNLYLRMLHANANKGKHISLKDFDLILEEISTAIALTRQITSALKPFQVERLSLSQAIKGHCQKLMECTGLSIVTEIGTECDDIDHMMKEQVYLIFQEALNNSIKHSQCQTITVRLQPYGSEQYLLSITDNGKGLVNPQSLDGIGLSLMKERAAMIEGELVFENMRPGCTVKLLFDLDASKSEMKI